MGPRTLVPPTVPGRQGEVNDPTVSAMTATWAALAPKDESSLRDALAAHPLMAAKLAAYRRLPTSCVPFLDSRLGSYDEVLGSIDRLGLQILQMARYHRRLTRERAIAEAPLCPPDLLDRTVNNLVVAGLLRQHGDAVSVHPELEELALPLPLFRDHLDSVTSDRLDVACRILGVTGGTKKADRAAAIEEVLRDPHRLAQAISTMGPGAVSAFERCVELTYDPTYTRHDPSGWADGDDEPDFAISVTDLVPSDQHEIENRSIYLYGRHGRRDPADMTPVERLRASFVLGSMHFSPWVWMWCDTHHALSGALLSKIALPLPRVTEPVSTSTSAPAAAVTALMSIVEFIGAQPAEGKKSVDRRPPIKVWRSAARVLGIDANLAVSLGDVAIELGLIMACSLPPRGRGRNTEYPIEWRPNPLRFREFVERDVAENWLAIVNSWLHVNPSTPTSIHDSIRRRLVIAELAAIPSGEGERATDFLAGVFDRRIILNDRATNESILADLSTFGMMATGGIVGLTDAGRAALAGIDEVKTVLSGGADQFILQPDHTIIAPGDLNPMIAAALHQYAEIESEGGATVWRLSAKRLGAASITTAPGEVVAFLRRHSSVEVPAVVERFITDAMDGVSPVTVRDVGCSITAADPVVISDAARFKTAKLTVLAPGVAVSELSAAKLSSFLSGKGIVLAGITTPGSPAPGTESPASPASVFADVAQTWIVEQRDPKSALDTPTSLGFDPTGADRIAAELSGRGRA